MNKPPGPRRLTRRAERQRAKVGAPLKWAIAFCNKFRPLPVCLACCRSAVQRAKPTASTTAARVSGSRWISVMGKGG